MIETIGRRLSVLLLAVLGLTSGAPAQVDKSQADRSRPDNSLLQVLRGTVTALAPGEFILRTYDLTLATCSFDEQTFFSRLGKATPMPPNLGEDVEIVSDRNGGRPQCFARAIRTLRLARPLSTGPATSSSLEPGRFSRSLPGSSTQLDFLLPRGNLLIAGVVTGNDGELLTLRLRSQQLQTFRLRDDTRFWCAGKQCQRQDLPANGSVFVRAGASYDGTVEAFQVVWGSIVKPHP